MTRFALLGYGAIGALRAQALRQTPGADLRLVVEPVAGRRAEAEQQGWPAAANLEDLLRRDDIDAVIVSTPPHLHRAPVEALLQAGKHVLCEKPLGRTVEECRWMVDTAQRHGRTLGTGFNYRFYPAVAQARRLIAEGRIGRITHVKSFAGHPGGPEFTHPWVHQPKIVGGGALMDNGIHVADLTLHFLGPVVESQGVATNQVWQFEGSEDNGYVLMRTADNKVGLLHASWTEWPGYRLHLEIAGTAGCLHIWYPPMLTVLFERPEGKAKKGRRHVFAFPLFQVQERLKSYRWTVVQSFIAEHQDFMRRIAGQPGVGATGLDGLRAVELAASAYREQAHSAPPEPMARELA